MKITILSFLRLSDWEIIKEFIDIQFTNDKIKTNTIIDYGRFIIKVDVAMNLIQNIIIM